MNKNTLDTFNMLIMGETGVGKSALLNYFANKELAKSGMNSSGGITKGIKKYNVKINDYNYCIADSEGLEAGNDKYWFESMDNELGLTSYKQDLATWYHSIVYCIGANGDRVKDTDNKMIEKVINAGYGCIIAFTKADISKKDTLLKLKTNINKHFKEKGYEPKFDFVEISSDVDDFFGKEEFFDKVKKQFLISLENRADLYIFNKAFKMIDDFEKEIESIIMNADIHNNKKAKKKFISNIESTFSDYVKNIKEEINNRYTSVFKQFEQIHQMLNTAFCKINHKFELPINNNINFRFEDDFFSILFKYGGAASITIWTLKKIYNFFDEKNENKKLLKKIKSELNEIRYKLKEQNKNFLDTLKKHYIIIED